MPSLSSKSSCGLTKEDKDRLDAVCAIMSSSDDESCSSQDIDEYTLLRNWMSGLPATSVFPVSLTMAAYINLSAPSTTYLNLEDIEQFLNHNMATATMMHLYIECVLLNFNIFKSDVFWIKFDIILIQLLLKCQVPV